MTNAKELSNILTELGGTASLKDIVLLYQKKNKRPVFSDQYSVFKKILTDYRDIFVYNHGTDKWSLVASDKSYTKKSSKNISIVDDILDEFVDGYFLYRDVEDKNGEILYRIATPTDKRICDIVKNNKHYKVYSAIKLKCIEKYFTQYSSREVEHRPYQYHVPVSIKNYDTKLIVCRVAYMKNYNGISEEDRPINGGSYVQKTGDAEEKYNFYNMDGYCYGFVETKHTNGVNNKLHIENIDYNYKGKKSIDNVRVVFVSSNPKIRKNIVIGWYDNAEVFAERQYHQINGNEHQYNIKCSYVDSHLIKEENRRFEIPNASVAGNDYGIGQSNIWYIKNNEKASKLLEELVDYINSINE